MDSPKTSVALLFGGKSSEHEVSLTSAASVLKAIDRDRFQVLPILIARSGEWFLVENPSFLLDNTDDFIRENCPLGELLPVILDYAHHKNLIALPESGKGAVSCRRQIDVALPILHGPGGEDGAIQGLLQMAGIPCAGAGILGSAVGLDKVIAKDVVQRHEIPTPPYCSFVYEEWQKRQADIIDHVAEKFGFPVFVKPANCGSSVGITKVAQKDRLGEAVDLAARHDRKILIEKGVNAREIECAVLGNDVPQASVLGEIVPVHEFYDYQAKYFAGSKLIIPAPVPVELGEKIRSAALAVYRALDCAGMGRVDFLLDKDSGAFYFNEINTIPGFTSQSMFPLLWQKSGVSYRELITRLLELAMERSSELKKLASRAEE